MDEWVRTYETVVPLLFARWRILLAVVVGEVLAYAIISVKILDPDFKGVAMLEAPPLWVCCVALAVLLFVAQTLVLHDIRIERDDLKRVTDYENAIGILSDCLDSGTALLNSAVTSDEEYRAWLSQWDQWRENVEAAISRYFGKGEKANFHNTVLYQDNNLSGFNRKHAKARSQLTHKLFLLKEIIQRHGGLAIAQRQKAQA